MDYINEQFMFDHPGVVLNPTLNLIDEGIIDSLGIFMLIDFVGQQFEFHIQADDVVMENFQSVQAIRQLVEAGKGTE
jgi:acyl carrier protein